MTDTSANVIAAAWAASAGTIIRPAAMKRIIDAIEPLIRAEEREACARVVEERANDTIGEVGRVDIPLFEVADLIRARSQP